MVAFRYSAWVGSSAIHAFGSLTGSSDTDTFTDAPGARDGTATVRGL